ncbi:hypothetical protein K438DRAFT_1776867 [Mycena galopus ATCC 62051]|nr:hypothetical protein K438DRAFT_1776867 [Mycena galopus ATCC 62051]
MLIMGNLHDIPKEFPWITYTEWAKRYGDVVHIEAFGNHILIVNSVKAAMEFCLRAAKPSGWTQHWPRRGLASWISKYSLNINRGTAVAPVHILSQAADFRRAVDKLQCRFLKSQLYVIGQSCGRRLEGAVYGALLNEAGNG